MKALSLNFWYSDIPSMLKILDGRKENCGRCGHDEYCPGVIRDFVAGLLRYSNPDVVYISKEFYREWYYYSDEILVLIENVVKESGYLIQYEPEYNDFLGIERVEPESINLVEDYRLMLENLSISKFPEIF